MTRAEHQHKLPSLDGTVLTLAVCSCGKRFIRKHYQLSESAPVRASWEPLRWWQRV